jgi:hypothetical protein
VTRSNSKPAAESEFLATVQLLTEEVKVLRQVVDELRSEVQWSNQNPVNKAGFLNGRRIHSCSLDPTSPDFTVNSVDDATVEKLRAELAGNHSVPGKQGELFN